MQLIVTRPKEDAIATASALQAAGHEAIIAPLISIETIFETPIPDQNWQGILVSSANGVRALMERSQASALSDTPLLAVGEASAGAAKDAGFSTVKSANGGLPELVRLACSTFTAQGGPLLYLSGTVISGDLKAPDGTKAPTGRPVLRTPHPPRSRPGPRFDPMSLLSWGP